MKQQTNDLLVEIRGYFNECPEANERGSKANEFVERIQSIFNEEQQPTLPNRDSEQEQAGSTDQLTGELFTGGDWSIGNDSSGKFIVFDKTQQFGRICTLRTNEEVEANALLIAESKNMYHALKVLAELDLTGVTGEIFYQRNKSKILVNDVLEAKAILSRITGNQ